MPPNLRPLALLAELTYRCPLKCPYCSNPLELDRYRRELDTATWQRVLAEAAALGVVQVHFSGGEPLVRRDLAELIRTARQLDLYSNLSTGATRVFNLACSDKPDMNAPAGCDTGSNPWARSAVFIPDLQKVFVGTGTL